MLVDVVAAGPCLFTLRHLPNDLSLNLDASLFSLSCYRVLVLCLFPQLSAHWPSSLPLLWTDVNHAHG